MKIKLTKNKFVGPNERPYIIAEIGSNHNGNMKLARQLIKSAKKSGADCVKFQSFSETSLFSKKSYQSNPALKKAVSKYVVSENNFIKIKNYARKLNLDFAVTPFSKKEVDFSIKKLGVKFIKIASMELNNFDFLKYISKKKKPIILSTGGGNLSDIDEAIRTIEKEGNKQIILLHCISNYPPKDKEINLNNIETLSRIYPYPVGFSDHTLGTSIPLAAVAKGACLIEKHFTLDKKMKGWDHHVSSDERDMKILVKDSRRIFSALGSNRRIQVENKQNVESFRRSLVAARSIKKGEVFTDKLIAVKRPGTGLPPKAKKFLLGKVATRNISYDEIIDVDDF